MEKNKKKVDFGLQEFICQTIANPLFQSFVKEKSDLEEEVRVNVKLADINQELIEDIQTTLDQ